MKTFLLSVALLITIFSKAQTCNLQVGAVTTFLGRDVFDENEFGLGGELVANISIQKNISVGPGVQLLKFNSEDNLYAPVFAKFKLDLPAKKIAYFLHADIGYGIHNFQTSFTDTLGNGTFKTDFKNTGGLYFASGAGIKFKGKFAPYLNLQYSLYGFKFVQNVSNLSEAKDYVYNNRNTAKGITITAGIFLDRNHNK
jgi:hypothetical protein